MRRCMMFRSYTDMKRAKESLTRYEISTMTEKNRYSNKYGCTWCIIFNSQRENAVISLMKKEKIQYTDIINYE